MTRTCGWRSRSKEQGVVRPGRQREVKQWAIRIEDTEIDRRTGDMDGANQVHKPVVHGLAARHRRKRADGEVHRGSILQHRAGHDRMRRKLDKYAVSVLERRLHGGTEAN